MAGNDELNHRTESIPSLLGRVLVEFRGTKTD